MKVRLKEDINIKDLAKNCWNGCQMDTLRFIAENYEANGEQEIFEVEKEWNSYLIGNYIVNPIAFEIVEEEKEEKEEEKYIKITNAFMTFGKYKNGDILKAKDKLWGALVDFEDGSSLWISPEEYTEIEIKEK